MKSALLILSFTATAVCSPGVGSVWTQKATRGIVFEIVGKKPLELTQKSPCICLRISNTTSKPIEVWSAGFWPNHIWKVTDLKGVPIKPTEEGTKRLALFGSLSRDKNAKLVVEPGKKLEYMTPSLLGDFDLKAGANYRVQIAYADALDTHKIVLRTKPVVFLVPSPK